MGKFIVKAACFFGILLAALGGANFVTSLKRSDGIVQPGILSGLPEQSCDVMFFGSSRVFENVDVGQLWDTWGIAAFEDCGSIQPLWDTYYYMQEAFETQHPKVAFLEV